MITVDPLYGPVELPEWLVPIIRSPEVQRLRDIRLINTSSTSCSSLSEARRFSHTLGVLFLALSLQQQLDSVWSRSQVISFLAAVAIHDIGTPPFGHLFEYQLIAKNGWNHEKFVSSVVRGTYRPEKRYHQLYYSNALVLTEVLRNLGLNTNEVTDMVYGSSALGSVLAGSLDIDNIDNVFRMALFLGLRPDITTPQKLIGAMHFDKDGLVLSSLGMQYLHIWQATRKSVYEVLAFDEACLSSQAMLTDCISTGLELGRVSDEHWFFTDEELLRHLAKIPETKHIVRRFAVGNYYKALYIGWYATSMGDIDLRTPVARSEMAERLKDATGIPCTPYVFYDSGTFSKRLNLKVREGNSTSNITLGEKSVSTVMSVFSPNELSDGVARRARPAITEVLSSYGFHITEMLELPEKMDIYDFRSQKRLQV